MHVTLDLSDWLDGNPPRNDAEKMALKYVLSRMHDDEPPYLFQTFKRDHFVTGYASVLWLQSLEAWTHLDRLVEERLGITIND